uniref:Uncharacterized protein n=1 Tax=Branchiostoma floridae TaxID=7739 RepID=C3YJJ3_BRAFL|eukprot:XP_002603581.1 hypothetical protein BRAFLDRAFT_93229 [Branchiostoma floridae]
MDGYEFLIAVQRGDVQAVRRCLQAGRDVNHRFLNDRTALHWASRDGNTEMVKLLVQLGADVEAKDKDGWTALHVASLHGNNETVKLLIQLGANVEAKDKDGIKPLDHIRDQDHRRFLKGPFTAFFRDRMTPDHQPHEPTPGVNVGTTNIPSVGEVSVWDFAGQSEYAVTHSMFMNAENTIFVVMYSIMDDSRTQEKKVHWWLCFIKSCNTKSKPNVILVASHADQTDAGGHQKASSLLELMTSEFRNQLDISDEVFLLDCRKTRKTDMRRLKDLLTRLKAQLLTHQRAVPKLCAEIIKCLPKWTKEKCSPKCPVLRWTEYKEAVMEMMGIDSLAEEDFLKESSKYLNQLGEILFVSSTTEPIVVLEPNWLCTDVFGKVMAPENFPIHLRRPEGIGIVTKEEIQKVFKDVTTDVDLLIILLQEFQLCHTFDGQEFIFPGLLTQAMPPEKWKPTADPAKTVYFGKQVQCADTTDMFSSGFFPRVQTRLMRQLKNRPLLWRDGAKCFDCNVESLIKLSPDGRAVNIGVRSEQADKPSCQQMLQLIENILTNELDECSPGTTTEERVLSARALREHREEVYSYSMDQIDKAKAEDGIVHHDILGFSEDVNDLLYGGRDDEEEEQGAVGNTIKQTIVYGSGNVFLRAGDHAHIDMPSVMQGDLGQLQLEGSLPDDLGQLQLEENVPVLQLE